MIAAFFNPSKAIAVADARPGRYASIAISTHQIAQGPVLREYRDGRVCIDLGGRQITGQPLNSQRNAAPVWLPLFAGLH